MALPLLRFIAHHNYCDVIIENLTALTVPQIKELEAFAQQRRGQLDFSTASFRIHKRIDFAYFNAILDAAGIRADTIESEIVEPSIAAPVEEPVIGFGKYRGSKYSEIPADYLIWLKKNYQGPDREYIENECRKRAI